MATRKRERRPDGPPPEEPAHDGDLGALVLQRLRQKSGATQLFTASQLAAGLPSSLRRRVTSYLSGPSATGALPDGVGSLLLRGRACFFLLDDVVRGPPAEAPGALLQRAVPGRQLEERFDEAYEQVAVDDQARLLDLRRALPKLSREAFDELILQLRRRRRYHAYAADGRHGELPREVLEAGVQDADGRWLVYLARRAD